jgi:hypothetical protein
MFNNCYSMNIIWLTLSGILITGLLLIVSSCKTGEDEQAVILTDTLYVPSADNPRPGDMYPRVIAMSIPG